MTENIKTAWTPEPWSLGNYHPDAFWIQDISRQTVTQCPSFICGRDEAEANAVRIVACVNACAGIANPEAVPELLARCQTTVNRLVELWKAEGPPADGNNEVYRGVILADLKAAIAKAEGGAA